MLAGRWVVAMGLVLFCPRADAVLHSAVADHLETEDYTYTQLRNEAREQMAAFTALDKKKPLDDKFVRKIVENADRFLKGVGEEGGVDAKWLKSKQESWIPQMRNGFEWGHFIADFEAQLKKTPLKADQKDRALAFVKFNLALYAVEAVFAKAELEAQNSGKGLDEAQRAGARAAAKYFADKEMATRVLNKKLREKLSPSMQKELDTALKVLHVDEPEKLNRRQEFQILNAMHNIGFYIGLSK